MSHYEGHVPPGGANGTSLRIGSNPRPHRDLPQPGPAYAAAPGNGRCDANEVCLFQHERFGGGVADFRCGSSYCEFRSFTSWTFGNGVQLNDAVSSVKNRTSKWVTLFPEAPPDAGQLFSGVEPNGEWAVLGWDWNDRISSMWISQ